MPSQHNGIPGSNALTLGVSAPESDAVDPFRDVSTKPRHSSKKRAARRRRGDLSDEFADRRLVETDEIVDRRDEGTGVADRGAAARLGKTAGG